MSIRRYIYISQNKIDNWLPQIDKTTQHEIAAKIGFNIGVLSGEIGTKREAGNENSPLVRKCQLLEHYIINNEEVGGLESGGTWIAGECSAKIFPLDYSGVIFVSQLGAVVLSMTGSSQNVVGAGTDIPKADGPKYLASFGYSVLEQLQDMAEREVFVELPADLEQRVESTVSRGEDPAWVRTIRSFTEDGSQAYQRVQCLAARLFDPYKDKSETKFALYTPLFVAYA
jgi:hypothetical protein